MHPAVVRATKIGNHAVKQGWTGRLDSEVVEELGNRRRLTRLTLNRNDEKLIICWRNADFQRAYYYIFDELLCDIDLVGTKQFIFGWPDILELFNLFPDMNHPKLCKTYVKLPFNWVEDDNETIMSKLIGRQIFWYERQAGKIQNDTVLKPKGAKAKVYAIKDVGHRKLFYFVGEQFGTRTVLLDTLLKVA